MRPLPASLPRRAQALCLWVGVALWSGCAGDYVARTSDVRRAYEASDYDRALAGVEKVKKAKPGKDELLVLLDEGMILHAAGRFQQSVEVLKRADKLASQLEVVSVSEEAATLFANERERAYRGEDFEKLMINVLQALNFAQLGDDEGALVEVRRLDLRLRKMIGEEKKPYQQLAIARYLAGVLYEDQKQYDDAFIEYWRAYELVPELGHLADAVLRVAKLSGREDPAARLRSRYPAADGEPLGPGEGEVVVVVESGRSPQKVSAQSERGGNVIAFPRFEDRWDGLPARVMVGESERAAVPITSIERVARVHLEHRVGTILARSLGGTAVKAGLAAGAGVLTRSEEVGVLAFHLLSLLNQPDLRSWLSLPAEFQLARFRLPEGAHRVRIESGGRTSAHDVQVAAGRVKVLTVRRF